jgi:SulP family sulfate permease
VIPRYLAARLDLSKVLASDGTAALAVEDMLNMVQAHHQHLFFVGMQPHVTSVLDGLGVLKQVRLGHRFANRLEALRKAATVESSSSENPSTVTEGTGRKLPATN